MLRRVQRGLEELYRIDTTPEVDDFVIDESVREQIGVTRRPREQLLLHEDGGELSVGLFIDRDALANLASDDPTRRLHDGNLSDFLLVVEGSQIDWGGHANDADWIIDGTIYDCKVSKRERPFSRRDVLQVLGYTLLDYDDAYGIQGAGWYYPRQQMRLTYPLLPLLEQLGVRQSLDQLRSAMRDVVTGTQR